MASHRQIAFKVATRPRYQALLGSSQRQHQTAPCSDPPSLPFKSVNATQGSMFPENSSLADIITNIDDADTGKEQDAIIAELRAKLKSSVSMAINEQRQLLPHIENQMRSEATKELPTSRSTKPRCCSQRMACSCYLEGTPTSLRIFVNDQQNCSSRRPGKWR